MIGSVLVLQALQGLSDRETAEALTYDPRWKAACGYRLNETAFPPTTLTYWRKRLAASSDPHRVMGAIADVVASTGVLKGHCRRAVDSTVLDDAVARQDTVPQLIAAVRRFGRDVPGGKELTAAHATGYDYTRTGKPDIAWDDEEARNALVSALVTDAIALLAAVNPETLDGKAADAYALFALVAGQYVEPADGSDGTDGRLRIARKVAPDRVISTVDTDARHAHRTREDRRDAPELSVVVSESLSLSELPLALQLARRNVGPAGVHQAPLADLAGIVRGLPSPGLVAMCQRLLAPLASDGGSALRETFDAYLRLSGNSAKICEELFIHRNTLSYRLRKIEELLKLDLSDGEVRATCLLALGIVAASK